MLVALTRSVPSLERCELTHLAREPIDHARAVREHAAYESALRDLGCRVERLPDLPDHPDAVFVEDTAVVFDAIAAIARPGAASRRGEVASVAAVLARYRPLAWIQAPGTLDGGDVLVIDRTVYVGISGRTNAEGARQLATIVAPHGLQVVPIPVTGCLHLKSAVTAIPGEGGSDGSGLGNRVLLNPAWVDPATFDRFDIVDVDPAEPWAANVLSIGGRVLCADAHPRTRRRLDALGISTQSVPAGELAKAEGGLTCGSIVFAA
jgi:dimethylargininase